MFAQETKGWFPRFLYKFHNLYFWLVNSIKTRSFMAGFFCFLILLFFNTQIKNLCCMIL
jgi:hypothetical protein